MNKLLFILKISRVSLINKSTSSIAPGGVIEDTLLPLEFPVATDTDTVGGCYDYKTRNNAQSALGCSSPD